MSLSLNNSKIENTHKSKETEEFLDIIFYRPLGYLFALFSQKMGFTPNGITIFSIFIGVAAGHFFYYNDLTINLIGIALLIFAEALDGADGQLARMTNTKSFYGRILDGFATNLWFISIYINLCLRMINNGESPAIFIVAIICGISHSFQSAIADYYRNYYLYFIYGKGKSEVSKSIDLQKDYKKLSWQKNFIKKFLMRIYINYTVEQEFLSQKSIKLFNCVSSKYPNEVPAELSDTFRKKNKPLIKYYNILTTNTRMIVLFIALIINYIPLYFIFEITVLNILLVYVVIKHETNAGEILKLC